MRHRRLIAFASDLPFAEPLWRKLLAAGAPDQCQIFDRGNAQQRAEVLAQAEIVVVAGDTIDDDILDAPHVKWVHCDHAGLNNSARKDVFDRGLIVTGSAGRSAPALAEHAMLFCLAHAARLPAIIDAQKQHRWLGGPELSGLSALYGKTMGIIGLGHTGRELAPRAKAFGMHVVGYRRRNAPVPDGVDRVYCAENGDDIATVIEPADYLILLVNLSDTTRNLINPQTISLMKPGAFIVNLSRGEVIDQDALISALNDHRIAGAGLDVTVPEPLPAGHPLWDAANVMITPHSSPPVADRRERSVGIIIENLGRYRLGQPMLNQLTRADIWTAAGR